MIRFEHVTKAYENVTPIRDMDAVFETGKIMTLIGPSGTGKSTILRMMNGLEKPTSGHIYYDDQEITGAHTDIRRIRRNIGMVFQHYNLFKHLSVLDNLVIPQMDVLHISRKEATEKAAKALGTVGLEKVGNKMPNQLSGGQMQRVAMARAMVMEPKVLLFDEPTSALDPNMVKAVGELIRNLRDGQHTVIIVTHDMQFAEEISDLVYYVDGGRIYEVGTPQQIFHEPRHMRTRAFIEQLKMLDVALDAQDMDYNALYRMLNQYAMQQKLDYRHFNSLTSVVDELLLQLLLGRKESRRVRLTAAYEQETDAMLYKVLYSGGPYDPFEEDNLSVRILKHILSDVTHRVQEDETYPNILKFVSH